MEIKLHLDGEEINLTKEELEYGLAAIIRRRKENKLVEISSDELELSKVFDIARELNRYAEEQDMGITIIAANPRTES